MIVSGYTLDLYCDTGGDDFGGACPHRPLRGPAGEFVGQSKTDCLKQAREHGWTFKEKNTLAYCPKCSRAKGKK